jgi:hypothetical protein
MATYRLQRIISDSKLVKRKFSFEHMKEVLKFCNQTSVFRMLVLKFVLSTAHKTTIYY